MELSDFFISLIPNLIYLLPQLIAWAVAVIIGVRMVKCRVTRAERFFLAGSITMLAGQIAEIVKTVHTRWLNLIEIMRWRTDGVSLQHIALRIGVVSTVYGVITSLLIVTGIIFLIFAFYLKFKQQSVEVPKPPVTSL